MEKKLIGMVEVDGVTLEDLIEGLEDTRSMLAATGITGVIVATGDEEGYLYFLADNDIVDLLTDEDDEPKGPLS